MDYINQAQARRDTGLSYLGSVNSSSKIMKNGKAGEMTYILYLAPADLSGYEVCPMRTSDCTAACLHNSGRNRMDIKKNTITNSRIKKTKLFFEERKFFMNWLVDEISSAAIAARNKEMSFSVRLNGTSDISLETMSLHNVCILNIFPDIQFYDYTKVFNRIDKMSKYPNYDLTFSFSGDNWSECENTLKEKTSRVAVVFENKLPLYYKGFKVVNGDDTDMRYRDPKGVITGLKFKKVRSKIDTKQSPFIIPENDPECVYVTV